MKKRRLLSLFLTIAMVISMLPIMASAEEAGDAQATPVTDGYLAVTDRFAYNGSPIIHTDFQLEAEKTYVFSFDACDPTYDPENTANYPGIALRMDLHLNDASNASAEHRYWFRTDGKEVGGVKIISGTPVEGRPGWYTLTAEFQPITYANSTSTPTSGTFGVSFRGGDIRGDTEDFYIDNLCIKEKEPATEGGEVRSLTLVFNSEATSGNISLVNGATLSNPIFADTDNTYIKFTERGNSHIQVTTGVTAKIGETYTIKFDARTGLHNAQMLTFALSSGKYGLNEYKNFAGFRAFGVNGYQQINHTLISPVLSNTSSIPFVTTYAPVTSDGWSTYELQMQFKPTGTLVAGDEFPLTFRIQYNGYGDYRDWAIDNFAVLDANGETLYTNACETEAEKAAWSMTGKVGNFAFTDYAAELEDAKADLTAKINAIADTVDSYDELAAVNAAVAKYESLSYTQRAAIDSTLRAKLTAAKRAAVNYVVAEINTLSADSSNLTADDADYVVALLETYSTFSGIPGASNKFLGGNKTYTKITGLKNAFVNVKNLAYQEQLANQLIADPIIERINDIGTVTYDKKATIEAIRADYDALDAKVQALVSNIDVLVAAEAAIATYEADNANYYVAVARREGAFGGLLIENGPTLTAGEKYTISYIIKSYNPKTTKFRNRLYTGAELATNRLENKEIFENKGDQLVSSGEAVPGREGWYKFTTEITAKTTGALRFEFYGAGNGDADTILVDDFVVSYKGTPIYENYFNAEADMTNVTMFTDSVGDKAYVYRTNNNLEQENATAAEEVITLIKNLLGVGTLHDCIYKVDYEYTDEFEAKLLAIEEKYYALTYGASLVTNAETWAYARGKYDESAVVDVIADFKALVAGIGTAEYTPEFRAKLEAAEKAYADATTKYGNAFTKKVTTEKETLDAARIDYNELSDAANQVYADPVIEQIAAIGTVDLSKEGQIVAARAAYTALDDEIKRLVTNVAALEAAEAALAQCKAVADNPYLAVTQRDGAWAGGLITPPNGLQLEVGKTYRVEFSIKSPAGANVGFRTIIQTGATRIENKAMWGESNLVISGGTPVEGRTGWYTHTTDFTPTVLGDFSMLFIGTDRDNADNILIDDFVIYDGETAVYSNTFTTAEEVAQGGKYFDGTKNDSYVYVTTDNKEYAKKADADAVAALIDAIGPLADVAYTEEYAAKINAADSAYAAMGEGSSLVNNANDLAQAKAKYNGFVYTEEKAALEAAVDALPVADEITADNKAEYEATVADIVARNDALPSSYRLVDPRKDKLNKIVTKIKQINNEIIAGQQAAIDAVIAKIEAIGTVTLDKAGEIEEARAAYTALDDALKSKVTNLAVLEAAEAALEIAEIEDAIDAAAGQEITVDTKGFVVSDVAEIKAKIAALPEGIEIGEEAAAKLAAIEAALEATDALDAAEFTVEVDNEAIESSDAAQTVVMEIKEANGITVDGIEFTVKVPEGWAIESIKGNGFDFEANEDAAIAIWNAKDSENVTIKEGDVIATVTYTVPANVAAGTYNVGVVNAEITCNYAAYVVNKTAEDAEVVVSEAVVVNYVAAIGDKQYETLAAAIEAAAKGATIELLADAEAVTVAKAVTINKNGFATEITVDGTTYGLFDLADAYVVYPKLGSELNRALSLKDMIQIIYYVKQSNFAGFTRDYVQENMKVLVWYEDNVPSTYLLGSESERIEEFVYDSSKQRYNVYTAGIPARMMSDIQKVRWCIEDTDGVIHYSDIVEYSPKLYCQNQYAKTTDETFKALLESMANYGAAMQIYAEYNTDNLMNSFLPAEKQNVYTGYAPTPLVTPDPSKLGFETTTVFEKTNHVVSLKGAFQFNVLVTMLSDYSAGNLSLMYWSESEYNTVETLTEKNANIKPLEILPGEKRPQATIDGIPARKLSGTYFYCVRVELDGEVYYSPLSTYSVNKYADNQVNKALSSTITQELKNLCKAIVIYGDAAKAYLGSN